MAFPTSVEHLKLEAELLITESGLDHVFTKPTQYDWVVNLMAVFACQATRKALEEVLEAN